MTQENEPVNPPQRYIGKTLRLRRQSRGDSLRAVARRVGISASVLSRIEKGTIGLSVDRLFSICAALAPDSRVGSDIPSVTSYQHTSPQRAGSGALMSRAPRFTWDLSGVTAEARPLYERAAVFANKS